MSHWRRPKFWIVWVTLLFPSAIAFALPGAIFGEEGAFERWAPVILPLQAFVTLAVPYIVAKRLTTPRLEAVQGFPVIQRGAADREAV